MEGECIRWAATFTDAGVILPSKPGTEWRGPNLIAWADIVRAPKVREGILAALESKSTEKGN